MARLLLIQNAVNQRRNSQRNHMRILRRQLRDKENPFTHISDEAFADLYKFPKSLAKELIDELSPLLQPSRKSHAIPSYVKVLSALRFFATGSFQRAVGQDALSALSQTSISRCLTEVVVALNGIAHHHVKFPDRAQFTSLKADFYIKHNFPGIIGIVDGTHIKISAPKTEIEHVYYCRKGGHSKNVLIVCDANYSILSACAKFGGTAHDAYVWRRSLVHHNLENLYNSGERNFWLLGDSGYPLQPWLMTPIANPTTTGEERYNDSHKATRMIVERCIGLLKSRFRCLLKERVLFYNPTKAGYIINACIVLHNILVRARVPFEEILEDDFNDIIPINDTNPASISSTRILETARLERNRLVREAFEQL